MNEHKYRVWAQVDEAYEMIYFTLAELLRYYNDENDYCRISDTPLGSVHDGVDADEVMKWTGTQDKVGKDIYQGDIVSIGQKGAAFGQVCFGDVSMPIEGGEYHFNYTGFYIQCADMERATEELNVQPSQSSLEVISHIYEHPELLPSVTID